MNTNDPPTPTGATDPGITIIYDGDCPFCRNYVRFVRLRETLGPVALVDARGNPGLAQDLARRGYGLDDGMVLMMDGQVYHGDDCLHRLALMSTGNGIFNRLNAWLFRSARVSRVLYPVLRAGRNTTLRLLGRRPISDSYPEP